MKKVTDQDLLKKRKLITRRPNGSIRVQTVNEQINMTDQSFKDDCDVNLILKRFMKTGQQLPPVTGRYADVSEVPNLDVALTQLNQAQSLFDNLSSDIRKRFGNSPVELVNFLKNPENYDEGVKLGLLNPRTDSQNQAKPPVGNTQKNKKPQKNDDELNDDDKKEA